MIEIGREFWLDDVLWKIEKVEGDRVHARALKTASGRLYLFDARRCGFSAATVTEKGSPLQGYSSSAIVSERTAAAGSPSVETTTRVVRNDDTAPAPD